MSYANECGRSPMQAGLDRNQAEGRSEVYCSYLEQEQVNEMPREQGDEILFAHRPRRPMRFTVDLQDAFKP